MRRGTLLRSALMGPVENPSAGRFGAASRERGTVEFAASRSAIDADWFRVIVLFALMIAEWVVGFKRIDASDHTPYRSTPHITR